MATAASDPKDGGTDPAEKPLWNSLEKAKLAVGLATPVAVSLLGVFLSLGAEQRSDDRTQAAERRSEKREIASQKRTFDWQKQVEDREASRAAAAQRASEALTKQMAELAARREELSKQQAAALDAEVRRRAEARDDAVRAQAASLDQHTRLVALRLKVWDELGPRLNDIYSYTERVGDWKRYKSADIIRLKRESDRLFFSYHPIWTIKFSIAYSHFMDSVFDAYNREGADATIKVSPIGREDPELFRFDPHYAKKIINPDIFYANEKLFDAASEALDLDEAAFK